MTEWSQPASHQNSTIAHVMIEHNVNRQLSVFKINIKEKRMNIEERMNENE
jgi:hypothetical protein